MDATTTRPIRLLPPETASRIAAGEVVERPLSALKEVVENALDAQARRVEVRVEKSLDQWFLVADDGVGISPADLELALERHATSKLSDFDDLDHLSTLGFRGEALPSIAAVSRMRLTSRPVGADAAAFVQVEAGQVLERGAAARAPGTTVEVRDLFFNTPARRKFLHSSGGELRASTRMLESYALARPGTAFRLVVDDRERFDWGIATTRRERAAQVWGARHAEQLLEASGERAGMRVYVLLGLPEHARATREGQVFLVNGRWVQSPALSQALRQAYGNLLPGGRFPTAVVWLDVPAERLDVNVHPTKREVRFADDDAVFSLVAASCAKPLATIHPPFTVVSGGRGADPLPVWAERVNEKPVDESQLGLGLSVPPAPPVADAATPSAGPAAATGAGAAAAGDADAQFWQLHRTYILAPVRGGLVIVGQLGWDLSPLGPPTVVIQGVPSGLKLERPGAVLQDILDGLGEGTPAGQEDIVERVARSAACHSAVRAGDALSREDMRALVDRLFATSRPHGDPHGRPTFVRMDLDELHRRFGRS